MWVVFRKSDGTVVGTSADSEFDIEKEKALAEVVAGREGLGDPKDYDAYQVRERGTLESLAENAARGLVRLMPGKTGGMDVAVQQPAGTTGPSQVAVSTDATSFHPVDNVPLIPGDGESFLLVTLQKVLLSGGDTALVPGSEDTSRIVAGGEEEKGEEEVIWLRASHGSLREDSDTTRQEIRSVTLVNGVARFRLYSEPAKRLVFVQMLSANPNLILDGLQVEFI